MSTPPHSNDGAGRPLRSKAVVAIVAFSAVLAVYLGFGFLLPPARSASLNRPTVSPEALVNGAPIVYLGSSTARENTRSERDKRNLAELLAADLDLPKDQIALIAVPGFHPLVYRAVIRSFTTLAKAPRLAIVPIEMRVFSVPWGGHPGLQHREMIEALQGKEDGPLDRVLQSLRLTPRRGLTDWFVIAPSRVSSMSGPPVPIPDRPTMSFADYQEMLLSEDPLTPERSDLQFRAHYLVPLDETHPMIEALVDLQRSATEQGITVVFEIGPVDVESLKRYTGDDGAQLERNVQLVTDILRRNGARYFIDNLEVIPVDEFSDQIWSCEHLTPAGRIRRAQAVADYLRAHSLV